MAEDFLVGSLLVCSACVNILAVGAFWVTPSLRTIANRFVINLLIVNFVSCLILSPSLLLNAFNHEVTATSVATSSILTTPQTIIDIDINIAVPSVDLNQTAECLNGTKKCTDFLDALKQDDLRITFTSPKEQDGGDKLSLTEIRTWGLDLVVALSVLSVLLVVGDTWCAVTDPLHYHSRMSDIKAWCLIATAWFFGLLFGVASALRSDQIFEADNFVIATARNFTSSNNISDEVYNTFFSYTYFIVIIILPFGLIVCMYGRIFSEARESGQRMRQNGSSPLLQSALNLAAVSAATAQQSAGTPNQSHTTTPIQVHKNPQNNQLCVENNQLKGGLTMKIDKEFNYDVDNFVNLNNTLGKADNYSKTIFLSTPPNHQQSQFNFINEKPAKAFDGNQQNQNILLTLTTSPSIDHLRRNFSARHLFIENNLQDTEKAPELRHVHSTPNLLQNRPPSEMTLLENKQIHHHSAQQVLVTPTIQVPTKALSYMTSIRHRLSNASSLFKYREESRAARISILVVIMFLVSYLPYGVLVLMQGHNNFLQASDQALLAIFTVMLANLSSPFIFAYRNKRVRRGVRRLLRIDKKTNERLQKLNNISRNYSTKIKNYRTNSKNVNFKPNNLKSGDMKRSCSRNSFASCKYLTPQAAATATMKNNDFLDVEKYPYDNLTDVSSDSSFKVKKSILKRVCDSSRKWGCTCADANCGDQTLKPNGESPVNV